MGYASKTDITSGVGLSQGYTARVRVLRKADADACQAALLGGMRPRISSTGSGSLLDQEIDNAGYTRELLLRGIASWTLDDDNGVVLPITAQTVELLTESDSTALVVAIKALADGPSLPNAGTSVTARSD